jgi:hypothetical protein
MELKRKYAKPLLVGVTRGGPILRAQYRRFSNIAKVNLRNLAIFRLIPASAHIAEKTNFCLL